MTETKDYNFVKEQLARTDLTDVERLNYLAIAFSFYHEWNFGEKLVNERLEQAKREVGW